MYAIEKKLNSGRIQYFVALDMENDKVKFNGKIDNAYKFLNKVDADVVRDALGNGYEVLEIKKEKEKIKNISTGSIKIK
jgi:hypothetical protein